jgi:hypothetical protein
MILNNRLEERGKPAVHRYSFAYRILSLTFSDMIIVEDGVKPAVVLGQVH